MFTEGPALLHRKQKAVTRHKVVSLGVLLRDAGKGRKAGMSNTIF